MANEGVTQATVVFTEQTLSACSGRPRGSGAPGWKYSIYQLPSCAGTSRSTADVVSKSPGPLSRIARFRLISVRLLILVIIGLSGLACTSAPITADLAYYPSTPTQARVVHLKSFNSLHDLVQVSRTLRDVIRGQVISPRAGTPAGIAYRNDHLYVCDTDRNALLIWDLSTGTSHVVGESGDATLGKPVAVTVDKAGVAYVADTQRGSVLAFDSSGRFIRRFKPPERVAYRPVSAAADQGKLYVADIADHRVDIFLTSTGEYVTGIGGVGSVAGTFYYPMGVAISAAGGLLVSDMMNARVQIFDDALKHVLSFGQLGNRLGDMGQPRNLAVGPDGVIFVADAAFSHVHLFNEQGQLLMLVGGAGDDSQQNFTPVGVAIARELPEHIAALVPADFDARYYLFVSSSLGRKRISLYAVGVNR